MVEHRVIINGLELVSPNRTRGHSQLSAIIHSDKVASDRVTVQMHVASKGLRRLGLPQSIHFVRIGPGRMDSDNVVSSFKAARDGMCKALGFDDKMLVIAEERPGIRCTFEQRRDGSRRGIEIHIRYP